MLRCNVEWARLENGREWMLVRCTDRVKMTFDFSPVYEYLNEEVSWFSCTAAMASKGQKPAFGGKELATHWGIRVLKTKVVDERRPDVVADISAW